MSRSKKYLACVCAIFWLSSNCSKQKYSPKEQSKPLSTPSISHPVALSLSAPAPSIEHDDKVNIDVVLAGDVIPHTRVLQSSISEILSTLPTYWKQADARVFNLEAPLGEREHLPSDKSVLVYATPQRWFHDLLSATQASVVVAANNHSCDLGPEGLTRTLRQAEAVSTPLAGASVDDPWMRVQVAEKKGRRVCLVAWTTFINDRPSTYDHCVAPKKDMSKARIAIAETGRKGIEKIHSELGSKEHWHNCDARIAYIHGGIEYLPQVHAVLEQAKAAASYVDAVIITHPHIPDGIELITVPGASSSKKKVPIFRSLGNFISNQGVAWSPGMSLQPPQGMNSLYSVWTRVGLVARLRFTWAVSDLPKTSFASIEYGYSLLFTDRSDRTSMHLRALSNTANDSVETRLRQATEPFRSLFTNACRSESMNTLPCKIEK